MPNLSFKEPVMRKQMLILGGASAMLMACSPTPARVHRRIGAPERLLDPEPGHGRGQLSSVGI
jgi:hypothetical protein